MKSESRYIHKKTEPRWRELSNLVPPLSAQARRILDILPKALNMVWPLADKHKRELYRDIRDLSAILTSERSGLHRSYWLSPGFISAYLYYFLPWNLVRFIRLLEGLQLPEPGDSSLLVDCGSGPLTLPIALWIARPQWRDVRIRVLATDAISRPLELGKKLFGYIAHIAGTPSWQIDIEQAPLCLPFKLYARIRQNNCSPWLLTAANALNELGESATQEPEKRQDRIGQIIDSWMPILESGAFLLLAEPGTRLGGTWIMETRECAMQRGLKPIAPCTHGSTCPLYNYGPNGLSRSWCHFIFSAQDAPDWLKSLSRKAGLFKTSLTISCLLLAFDHAPDKGGMPVRVISQAFPAGGILCRYGCAACGLGLLKNARGLFSGSLCDAIATAGHDIKSRAIILEPAAQKSTLDEKYAKSRRRKHAKHAQ